MAKYSAKLLGNPIRDETHSDVCWYRTTGLPHVMVCKCACGFTVSGVEEGLGDGHGGNNVNMDREVEKVARPLGEDVLKVDFSVPPPSCSSVTPAPTPDTLKRKESGGAATSGPFKRKKKGIPTGGKSALSAMAARKLFIPPSKPENMEIWMKKA